MATLPEETLGADLVWWRVEKGMRTVATVFWGHYASFPQPVYLDCVLFDQLGKKLHSWRIAITTDKPVVIDSSRSGHWDGARRVDGILALYVNTDGPIQDESRKRFRRLYTLVDWISDAGDVVTLHSDQVIERERAGTQQFTEIVVVETEQERNSLVFLNGEVEQQGKSVTIDLKNASGDTRQAVYEPAMPPFTVHSLQLSALVPDLVDFAGGSAVTVSGKFKSAGLFSRPYIVTEGTRLAAYHGGDVYNWRGLPFVMHALVGGEVNPMAVVSNDSMETVVNILHSHGSVEDDVWVDAKLFDLSGTLVSSRPHWLVAKRHSLSRESIRDLLPNPEATFAGHVALSFSPERGAEVPRRLQALIEYRGNGGTSRVMAWSDEWNSRLKLAKRKTSEPPMLRSNFRVWCDSTLKSDLSITNPGHPGYAERAEVTLILLNSAGESIETSFSLGPYAGRLEPLTAFFEQAEEFLSPEGIGTVVCESTSDLANVCFTRHTQTGVYSAEHFMAMETLDDGVFVMPAGS